MSTRLFVPGAPAIGSRRRIILPGSGGGTGPSLAKLTLNDLWVAEGDSITAGSNGPQWEILADMASGGRFTRPLGWNQATGGQTAAQMSSQIAQVTALNPKVVTFLAGTNDLSVSSTTPVASIYASILACVKGYLDGGVKYVVVSRVLPRSDTVWVGLGPQRELDRQALNAMIANLPTDPALAAYAGQVVLAANIDSTFNPATDTSNLADAGGLHPNWLGAIKLGQSFAAGMNAISDTTKMSDLYLDASNLLLAADNPAFTGTTGTLTSVTGTSPTGWTTAQNDSMTVVGSASTLNGATAQHINVSGTCVTKGHAVILSNPCVAAGAIGDSFEACIDFSLASGMKGLQGISIACGTTAATQLPGTSGQPLFDGAPAISGTIRTPVQATLTAAVTSVTFQVVLLFNAGTVAADVSFSRPYFRKV